MERLGDRNIGLDAETGKEAIYEKYGFKEASLSMLFFSFHANYNAIKKLPDPGNSMTIQTGKEVDFNKLIEYEQRFNKISKNRKSFLKVFYDDNNATTFLALDVEGNVLGLACCWKEGDLNFVRPLYANDILTVQILWKLSLEQFPSETKVTAITPLQNEEAVKMMKETLLIDTKDMCMDIYMYTTRMYTGNEVQLPIRNVYPVTDLSNSLI